MEEPYNERLKSACMHWSLAGASALALSLLQRCQAHWADRPNRPWMERPLHTRSGSATEGGLNPHSWDPPGSKECFRWGQRFGSGASRFGRAPPKRGLRRQTVRRALQPRSGLGTGCGRRGPTLANPGTDQLLLEQHSFDLGSQFRETSRSLSEPHWGKRGFRPADKSPFPSRKGRV